MKSLLYLLFFLIVFGISFYFFIMNTDQTVSLKLFGGVKTPALPVGMVVIISFFGGFLAGIFFLPLTYIIRRLS